MGYIDDQAITLNAILTKRGRELLASGQLIEEGNPANPAFSPYAVSRWSISDDGVDYRLWNDLEPAGGQPIFKPVGSTNPNNIIGYTEEERGASIEQLPILEPNPSGIRHMRNKLISADQTITNMPIGALQVTELAAGTISVNVLSYQLTTADPGLILFPVQLDPQLSFPDNAVMGPMGNTVVVRDTSCLSLSGFSNPNPPLNMINPTMGELNGKTTATVSSYFFILEPLDFGGSVGSKRTTAVYIYDNELGFEILIEVEVEIAA